MITNLAGYTLSPFAFRVSHRHVSAQALIVPALGEPIQPKHLETDRDTGETVLSAMPGKPDGGPCGRPLAEITDSADNTSLLRNTGHSGIGAAPVHIDREPG
mgnify:CR=1 FL=1